MRKGLRGGQASSGPHPINKKHDTMSRQRMRANLRTEGKLWMLRKFGGISDRSRSPEYDATIGDRRTRRAIVRDRIRNVGGTFKD